MHLPIAQLRQMAKVEGERCGQSDLRDLQKLLQMAGRSDFHQQHFLHRLHQVSEDSVSAVHHFLNQTYSFLRVGEIRSKRLRGGRVEVLAWLLGSQVG